MSDGDKIQSKLGFGGIVCYLVLWILSTALVLVDLALLRNALLETLAWFAKVRGIADTAARFNFGFFADAVDRSMLLVMSIVGLGVAIAFEPLYRHMAQRHRLFQEGWRVIAILVGIALFSLLVRFVL